MPPITLLDRDMFIELVKGWEIGDILALCDSPDMKHYCDDDTFWEELIRRTWDGKFAGYHAEDYTYFWDITLAENKIRNKLFSHLNTFMMKAESALPFVQNEYLGNNSYIKRLKEYAHLRNKDIFDITLSLMMKIIRALMRIEIKGSTVKGRDVYIVHEKEYLATTPEGALLISLKDDTVMIRFIRSYYQKDNIVEKLVKERVRTGWYFSFQDVSSTYDAELSDTEI